MARGKNDRRGERFDPRSFANDPDIARLLQEMGVSILGKNGGIVPSKAATSELLNDWQDAIGGLISGHSLDKRRRAARVKGSLELKSVNRDDGCEVVLKCGASTYLAAWTFDLDARTFSTSCNCGHQDLCEHTYFMAVKIKDLLNNPRSELVAKIVGEDLTDRNLKQTFSMLQSLGANADGRCPKVMMPT